MLCGLRADSGTLASCTGSGSLDAMDIIGSPCSGRTIPRRRLRTKTRVSSLSNEGGGQQIEPSFWDDPSPPGGDVKIDPSLWASPSPPPKPREPKPRELKPREPLSTDSPLCSSQPEGEVNVDVNSPMEWSDRDLAATLRLHQSEGAQDDSVQAALVQEAAELAMVAVTEAAEPPLAVVAELARPLADSSSTHQQRLRKNR